MEIQELLKDYKELKKQVESVKKEMKKKAKVFFKESFKVFFDKYPNLQEVRWTAYTPYFNDGEPCVFSSNHEYADIEGEGYNDKNSAEFEKAEKEIMKFLKQFDDELMLAFFGEEVEVTIDKKGVTTGHCNHD